MHAFHLLLFTCLPHLIQSTNCDSVEVKKINTCLYALTRPDPDEATKEEKCQYATTYFMCFSGGCCKDPNFQKHIEFIKKDIESLKCSTPVQCATATSKHSGSIILPLVVMTLTGLLTLLF